MNEEVQKKRELHQDRHAVIKFYRLRQKSATKTYAKMCKAYVAQGLSHRTVFEWHEKFSKGWESARGEAVDRKWPLPLWMWTQSWPDFAPCDFWLFPPWSTVCDDNSSVRMQKLSPHAKLSSTLFNLRIMRRLGLSGQSLG